MVLCPGEAAASRGIKPSKTDLSGILHKLSPKMCGADLAVPAAAHPVKRLCGEPRTACAALGVVGEACDCLDSSNHAVDDLLMQRASSG